MEIGKRERYIVERVGRGKRESLDTEGGERERERRLIEEKEGERGETGQKQADIITRTDRKAMWLREEGWSQGDLTFIEK